MPRTRVQMYRRKSLQKQLADAFEEVRAKEGEIAELKQRLAAAERNARHVNLNVTVRSVNADVQAAIDTLRKNVDGMVTVGSSQAFLNAVFELVSLSTPMNVGANR